MGVPCSRCCLKQAEFEINRDRPNGRNTDPEGRHCGTETWQGPNSQRYIERTTRVSVDGSEFAFDLPDAQRPGIVCISYKPSETSRSVSIESIIPKEETSQERNSPNNTDRTTRVSVDGSEFAFERALNGESGIIYSRVPERRSPVIVINKTPKRGGIFTCRYTAASFRNYIRKKRFALPHGNFVDCRNISVRNSVCELQELVRWSHSVCQIRFGNGTATGFRVGSRLIMTASHVVEKIAETILPRKDQRDEQKKIAALGHPNVFCFFDYFQEHQFGNVRKYFLKPVIHFYDAETDTAVLELTENSQGAPLPPPFQHFSLPNIDGKFTLLGHVGSEMEYNMVDLIIDKDHETTRHDIRDVLDYNDRITDESYEFLPYNTLTNVNRLLFHCKFGKGASGSPGISVQADGSVAVVTMLVCGFPNWYYNENVDRNLRQQWPKEYCIEQGADMMSVENSIKRKHPNLHKDIFCRYNLPNPADIFIPPFSESDC